jgi:hypothetical protein
MIDGNNYESYFLDFLEGKLAEQEVEMLMAFLKNNPDLEESLIHYDKYVIESNPEITLSKNFLLKSLDNFHSINEHNFDEFCVAYYEKDLSTKADEELSKYLNVHPEKLRDFENYGKVYINPPLNLKYPFKSRLKKITLLPFYKIAYISTAAAAILLLFIYLIPSIKQFMPAEKQTVAITEEKNEHRIEALNEELEMIRGNKTPDSKKSNQVNPGNLYTKEIQLLNDNKVESLHKDEINLKSINSIKINNLKPPISIEKIYLTTGVERKNVDNNTTPYLNIREFAIRKLHKTIEPNLSERTDQINLTWWDLARLGVKGINKLTGSEIKMDGKINEEGKIVAMVIESGKLSFSRSESK